MNQSVLFWMIFATLIVVVLALDLGLFHKKSHTVSVKEAVVWTAVWITLSISFGTIIFFYDSKEAGPSVFIGLFVGTIIKCG